MPSICDAALRSERKNRLLPAVFKTEKIIKYALHILLFACTFTLTFHEGRAEDATTTGKRQFVRATATPSGTPKALEVAVTRYVSKDPRYPDLVVDLVGAVHVADRAYYEKLNDVFDDYDVVLYELVANEGKTIPDPKKLDRRGVLSNLQNGMGETLELTFQLSHVDYRRDNMVHADMSAEEFSNSMRKRKESLVSIMFRTMGFSMARDPSGQTDTNLLAALFSPNRAMALKRILAKQFSDMEGSISVFNGEGGSTLITERNKVALKRLEEQIKKGKKKIAIFYGAGHMPDMEKRLLKDFNMKWEKNHLARRLGLDQVGQSLRD